jgi:hypothetical protein
LGWPLSAQFYNGSQLNFGKNRVQHQHFNWLYYRTEKFDIYYYPTGKALADYTFFKVPGMVQEIEQMLNFTSSKKLQFIVYNTQSDFRESNFGFDNDDFYNQGGITNVYGAKIYLYFDGNHAHLDRMIKSGIMNVYAHLLLEGESLRSNISAEYLFNAPAWFYTGLASYISENWNSVIDAHVKNGILTQKYADFEELSPVDATYAGHSFWKFIADRYGQSAIANILYATRSSRSTERGFYAVTGIPYKQLLIDWYRYYYVVYSQDLKRNLPEHESLLPRPKRGTAYSNLCLAPDGESFAYTTNEAGQVKVWLKTPGIKKPEVIFKRYQKSEDNPDLSFPLLAWHPAGEVLGITLEDRGRCYYYPYMISEKKLEKRLWVDVEKILDWSYSPDGRLMLFSGFKNGQSDLFLYSFQSRSYQNITNDIYDDLYPRFINGQKQIVFSSNRSHDTLNSGETFHNAKPMATYDLFLYHYGQKDNRLMRLTHTPYANETDVRVISPQKLLFLSDENGIINRYIARFDSSIIAIDTTIHYTYSAQSVPLTDNSYSILNQDYASSGNRVAEVLLLQGAERIYIYELPLEEPKAPLGKTVFQSKMVESKQLIDSLTQNGITYKSPKSKRGFQQVRQSDIFSADSTASQRNNVLKPAETGESNQEFETMLGRNYYVQYTLNQFVAQADFSFLNTSYQQFTGSNSPIYLNAGINALFMIGLKDLFEDHRISAGVRLGFDLNSYEVMFSYENLARRLDHQLVVYRQSINSTIQNYYIYKQRTNSLFYIMKYPFDKWNSLRLTLTGRYETAILGGMDDRSLQESNAHHVWSGAKLEYVFDSSKELYTNLWKGTKLKIFVEYEQLVEKDQKNLFVFGFDFRKSVKVFKKMTWATRLAGSTNIGTARLIYYMGGIDNWMLAKFNSEIWVDNSRHYAYQTLATNMRGFEQNIRNGTSFVVLNTELRIPFVQLLARRKVGNTFLNSLQLVLFADYGTAWTGINPYGNENSLYYRHITKGPISAVVKRNVDPFVGGIGMGLRASLFGYFLRLDWAWGIEDGKIYKKAGMLMFSLGMDF